MDAGAGDGTPVRITAYSFGSIGVDDRAFQQDVLVLPPRVLCPWWRKQGHSLAPEDLEQVLVFAPEVLVVGTGAYGVMKVPAATCQLLEGHGTRVEVLPTAQAVERFNRLADEGVRVAAALHLTC